MPEIRNQGRSVKASKPVGVAENSGKSKYGPRGSTYQELPEEYRTRANIRANEAFLAARRERIARNNRGSS